MGHGYINRGVKTTFATRKELAWHGLGKVVDAMTSKEAIELGGLDFKVDLAPIYAHIPTKLKGTIDKEPYFTDRKEITTNFATYRTDNNNIFGIVGSRYEVIQNQEAFDFFDSIIGDGHAEYETVGALGNGETVFITAKLSSKLHVHKENIDKYLLLSMSHDGSSSIQVMFTPIRVVCNNTLSWALQGKNKVNVRHTKNARNRLELSKKILGITDSQSTMLEQTFNRIADTTIYDKQLDSIIETAFNFKRDKETNRLTTVTKNKVNQIKRYYHTGVGQEGIVGTGWGVYNAITGYLQNGRKVKDNEDLFKKTFMGKDEVIRNRAMDVLLRY